VKIFVGGLLAGQQRLIEAACPPGVELRFANVDVDPRSWERTAKGCDYGILYTKFISHKHGQVVGPVVGTLVLHSGGLTRLKAIIQELAERAP
jgi:hypothetical protein